MIFPWLRGFVWPIHAPVSWVLLWLNVFWFIALGLSHSATDSGIDYSDIKWVESQKEMVSQYMENKNINFSKSYYPSEAVAYKLLLEPNFVNFLNKNKSLYKGDLLTFEYRINKIQKYLNNMQRRPAWIFGYQNGLSHSFFGWLTYQFMHGGWFHLVSNMILLIIFAGAIEFDEQKEEKSKNQLLKSVFVLLTYILSGAAGAYFFSYLSPDQEGVPLIGASASVSGLIGAYLVLNKNNKMRFFYFLGVKDWGYIYLPVLTLFVFYFVVDIAARLSQDPLFSSGVANVAHIGGFLFGAMLAWLKLIYTRFDYESKNNLGRP